MNAVASNTLYITNPYWLGMTLHTILQHANKASWYTTHVIECIQYDTVCEQCAHPSSLQFGSILFNIAIISYWISSNSSFNASHIDSTSCNIYNIFNVELTITYTCSVYIEQHIDSYCSTMIMMKESVFVCDDERVEKEQEDLKMQTQPLPLHLNVSELLAAIHNTHALYMCSAHTSIRMNWIHTEMNMVKKATAN